MRGCGDAVHAIFDLVVDNIWIAPDGAVAGDGRPADAEWLIRNAGWVFAQRMPGRLGIVIDIRCAGSRAVAAALDLMRAAQGAPALPAVDRYDLWLYDGLDHEQLSFGDPLRACHHLLQCLERADAIEAHKFQLYRRRVDRVATEELSLSGIEGHPRLARFLALWRGRAAADFPAGAAATLARDISVFRITDGEPRMVSMGGGLMFGARDAAGARLEDLVPPVQAAQSRRRILQAVRSRQPVLRRYRTALYDVMLLTVAVEQAGEILSFSIAERQELAAMPSALRPAAEGRAAAGGGDDGIGMLPARRPARRAPPPARLVQLDSTG